MKLLSTIVGKKIDYKKDISAGIIIALMSIPMAIGYAQIAGLPAIYGLYGSIVPIIVFAVFSNCPYTIFGIDAAPAAMTGAALASAGIAFESAEAMRVVAMITFFTAVWLFIFALLRFGNLAKYISEAVLSGFVTGIGTEIILKQIPKLYGGTAGQGELLETLSHIAESFSSFSLPAFILGAVSLALLLFSKHRWPKFPMVIVVMLGAALADCFVHFESFGIAMMPEINGTLPKIINPVYTTDWSVIRTVIGVSLSNALVITTETLLTSDSVAKSKGTKFSCNQEIVSYAFGNLAASVIGVCPVSGSAPRMNIAVNYGSDSQLTGLTAGLVLIPILLFGTAFIPHLPVPVLTGIVIYALTGILEINEGVHLFRIDRREFGIFMAAFAGVLIFGVIYGVVIGVVLSFLVMVMRTISPNRSFLGVVHGQTRFFDLTNTPDARPISGAALYRFSADLYFANIDAFEEDIEAAAADGAKTIIVDASGINSLDYTAARRIDLLYRNLKKRGIRFFLTEHSGAINDTLRKADCDFIIYDGGVARTMTGALLAAGYHPPYPTDGENARINRFSIENSRKRMLQDDLEWAYGDEANDEIKQYVEWLIEEEKNESSIEKWKKIKHRLPAWNRLNKVREDDLLEHLEMRSDVLSKALNIDEKAINEALEHRRRRINEYLKKEDPDLYRFLVDNREAFETAVKNEIKKGRKDIGKRWSAYLSQKQTGDESEEDEVPESKNRGETP